MKQEAHALEPWECHLRTITLYTRPGCHLCEDAADLLERLARRIPITIVEVNILDDVDLFERFKHSIPVVAIAGGPTLAAPIRAEDLERALIADGVSIDSTRGGRL